MGFYGIQSRVQKTLTTGNFPNGKDYGKMYKCYRLRVGGKINIEHFKKIFKLSHKRKQKLLDSIKFYHENKCNNSTYLPIDRVEKTKIKEDVWDITVYDEQHIFRLSHCFTGNCSEILLRSNEFCNLSEVVIKETDDLDDVLDKIETATWLGTIQSTFTRFPYLNRKWKNNCEDERLLGVSLTGQMDNPKLLTKDALTAMRKKAIKVARRASKILKINMPAAITCVKPSGSVSQLVNSSSGVHPRFSKYYIRRYRISSIDPLFKLLKDSGVYMSPENGQRESDWKKAQQGEFAACTIYEKGKRWTEDKVNTWVVSFPVKSPKKSVIKNQISAIQQLEHYKKIQKYWCEHNTSCTVYVKEDEWFEVGNWVYKNWKYITGVSFLPYDGGKYEQAPYEEIDKSKYNKMIKSFIDVDYSQLYKYENIDNTSGAKTYSCTGDKCEI